MSTRKRRYLGCLGWIAIFFITVVLGNAAIGWCYRLGSAGIAREMARRGYPATFEELVAKQNDTQGMPNGADDYLSAFDRFTGEGINFDIVPVFSGWELPPPGTPIPTDAMAEMKQLLDMNRGYLELIASGGAAEVCRFPIDVAEYEEGGDRFPGELPSKVRNAARFLSMRALYSGESGDTATAIRSIEELMRLGSRFADQPSVSVYLTAAAVLPMGYWPAEELVSRGYVTTPEQIRQLEDAIAASQGGDLLNAYWGDLLLDEHWTYVSGFDWRSVLRVIGDVTSTGEDLYSMKMFFREHTFLADIDNFAIRTTALELARALKEPLQEGTRRMHRLAAPGGPFAWAYQFASPGAIRNVQMFFSSTPLGTARQHSALAVVRVAKFRSEKSRLPDDAEFKALVADIPDPYTGETLKFRSDGGGYAVYSVGRNDRDDGGVRAKEDGSRTDDEVAEIRFAP